MTRITLSQLTIILDILGLIILTILYVSSITEKMQSKNAFSSFLRLLLFTILTLLSNIVYWLADGKVELSSVSLITASITFSMCFFAILCFLNYLRKSLYPTNRIVTIVGIILSLLCVTSVAFFIGNIFGEYALTVNEQGRVVPANATIFRTLLLTFPSAAFASILLAQSFAKGTSIITRLSFILCILFPVVGLFIDLTIYGLSLTYIGFVISILLVYTGIYQQKRKKILEQQSALMLSQINPHFMYNTLSTIAAMCDIEPRRAKQLTLEFSQYLRSNLTSLSSNDLIPFAQEMNHVECYLKIEKARFQENLNVSYSIHCKDFYVPPLSIQPIVENAVRHGITRKAGGGTVYITSYSTPKHYVIVIRDDGVGFAPDQKPQDGRKHVGLENVSNRIRHMCNGRLEVRSIVGKGTRAAIIIPKKYAHPDEDEKSEK